MLFQNHITSSRLTLPVATLLSVAMWAVCALLCPTPDHDIHVAGADIPWWAVRLCSFILCTASNYFLIQLNNRFALIRTRASIETSVALLLSAACPAIHFCLQADVAGMAFLLAAYFLFEAYHRTHPSGYLFRSFLFLGMGSMAVPQLTLMVPLFWAGAWQLRALTPRSLTASLTGWFLPYWFLLGHAYFHEEMELFRMPFQALASFSPVDFSFSPSEIATLAYLFVLFAVSSVHYLLTAYNDKLDTRCCLRFLLTAGLVLFALSLLQPPLADRLLPTLLAVTAILVGRMLTFPGNRLSSAFFIATLAGLFLLFGFNLWTLL